MHDGSFTYGRAQGAHLYGRGYTIAIEEDEEGLVAKVRHHGKKGMTIFRSTVGIKTLLELVSGHIRAIEGEEKSRQYETPAAKARRAAVGKVMKEKREAAAAAREVTRGRRWG